MKKQALLCPYQMRSMKLNNRVVMAPMTRSRADSEGNVPSVDMEGVYYAQRASSGLIITEGAQVSREAVGYINTPGIYSEAQVAAWKEITQKVHDKGGRIVIQLWHVGRVSHPYFQQGRAPLAPSAINPGTRSYTPDGFQDTVTPRAMSKEDIERTKEDFVRAAKNAMRAGFDGVEIHASNGYLFHQFFSNCSNTRNDAYGGSIPNKIRFLFEVIEAMSTVVPESFIGVRLNPSYHGMSGISIDKDTIPTFDAIVQRLNDYDLSYLHLSEPFNDVSEVPYAETNIARRYRPMYNGTLMINTDFSRETGNAVLEEGLADLVAIGKPFISNPDLVERFAHKLPLEAWDKDTFFTTGSKGYTDYPFISE